MGKGINYDVFNGDADGICALIQLHLAEPSRQSHVLITDIKRNINLLKMVPLETKEQTITILDISLDKNRTELLQLLDNNNHILYADHHFAGDLPENNNFQGHIDTQANTCTSLIVYQQITDLNPLWAITGAYGDNMLSLAEELSDNIGLSQSQKQQLSKLGIYINYNGYGAHVDDLHFHPSQLFRELLQSKDPLAAIADPNSCYQQLEQAYHEDMRSAQEAKIHFQNNTVKVLYFEDAAWCRRVNGVYGNHLANQEPDIAHAIIIPMANNTVNISVRAPLNNKQGADEICRQFPNGGGRQAAAGINQLPLDKISLFIDVFSAYY